MHQDLEDELKSQFHQPEHILFKSIRDGKTAVLSSLLTAPSPPTDLTHAHPTYGLPLSLAAWYGDYDAVELLLVAGADPEATSSASLVKGTAIELATAQGHRDIVKRLWTPAAQEIQL
jgi:hypothetical protein